MGIKEWFAKKYKSDVGSVGKMTRQIGYVESKNVPTAIQKSNVYDDKGGVIGSKEGPGRGLYQFETSEGGGSGAFGTALNRSESLYKKMGQEVPSWLTDAREHGDASKLKSWQQEEILLGDLAMKSGSDKLISEALSTGSAKNLWLKKHWAGAKEGTPDYLKKSSQWDKGMKTYGTDVAMSSMLQQERSMI